ncbi:unnamed protein product [Cyclocybe aegerita]|uniref:Uncharacterized protein n=1 Tax=Cyclocybe aegerita TaxID=1973307 RepID=A0A8S0VVZ8_CYCAE|nr:unnamed protein product [Cyclocybe aegerita]
MTNLKELFIKVGQDYPQDILEGCPFKLHSFSWYHEIEGADFANLRSFLDEQDELRHLQADWTYQAHGIGPSKPVVLPPSVCPKLDQLTGNHGIIEMVLPHRRLRTLVWDTLLGDPKTSFKHLAKELSHIEAFSCYESPNTMTPPLSEYIPYFQNLKFCQLYLDRASELEVVYQLPSLVGIVVAGRLNSIGPEWKGLVKVFERCQKLQFIDAYTDDSVTRSWRTPQRFKRWSRPSMLAFDSASFTPPDVVDYSAMDITDHIQLWKARKVFQ